MRRFFSELFAPIFRVGAEAGPQILSGPGTPEGAITAPVGSIFMRTDGGTGTTIYRKESGTGNTGWAATASGGGSGDVVGPGSATDNAIARFDTTTGKLIQDSGVLLTDAGELTMPNVTSPAVPAAGQINAFGKTHVGRARLGFQSEVGNPAFFQEDLAEGRDYLYTPTHGTTTFVMGFNIGSGGTATQALYAAGSRRGRLRRLEYRVTTASTTAVAFLIDNYGSSGGHITVGGASAWEGGFRSTQHFGTATGATNATHRAFFGICSSGSNPTDVNPSTLFNIIGCGWDSGDTNLSFMHNDASGAATKIDLGASFPRPTVDQGDTYKLEMYSPPGTTQSVTYRLTRLESGAVAEGVVTTNLPLNTLGLHFRSYMSVGGTSSVVGIMVGKHLARTEY